VKPGPLWGARSWNDGAGAARVYTLAGYIRYAMPLTQPGILSDEEAQHVAAYINAQERPVYSGKADDYPGGAPIDAVYYPRYPENPLRARLQAPGSSTNSR
jgi:thiosulfate dehydrogenase